jgi:hypothetical protein
MLLETHIQTSVDELLLCYRVERHIEEYQAPFEESITGIRFMAQLMSNCRTVR